MYSKTCLKQPLKRKTKNWVSRPIVTKCRSQVLQNALLEHSTILSTFIKLPFVFKTFVLSIFLSGRLRQVLLYIQNVTSGSALLDMTIQLLIFSKTIKLKIRLLQCYDIDRVEVQKITARIYKA